MSLPNSMGQFHERPSISCHRYPHGFCFFFFFFFSNQELDPSICQSVLFLSWKNARSEPLEPLIPHNTSAFFLSNQHHVWPSGFGDMPLSQNLIRLEKFCFVPMPIGKILKSKSMAQLKVDHLFLPVALRFEFFFSSALLDYFIHLC